MLRISMIIFLALSYSLAGIPCPAQQPDGSPTAESMIWFQEYLRVDTTNPPGNEQRAVVFLSKILDKEGIPYRTFESSPGRGNIFASIKGSGKLRPMILLNHLDVVPADATFWTAEPFAGTMDRGYVIGRGALDMKSLAIAQLNAFIQIHRSGRTPVRDLIFLGTADEEAGGRAGAGWLVKNRPELFREAEYLLTEGGSNLTTEGEIKFLGIEVTQKVPCWLSLESTGEPGHGSVPRSDSAVNRLVRALERLRIYREPYKLVPAVARYFHALAPFETDDQRAVMQRIEEEIKNPDSIRKLRPQLQALLCNTISITGLRGSDKINVIAPRATAELDCRLLPGEDPARFVARLEELIGDPTIKIERVLSFPPAQSEEETALFNVLRTVARDRVPGAKTGTSVSTGFTDSHYFRELGITCYGFSPFGVDSDDQRRAHGNDERITVRGFLDGVALYLELVSRAVYSTN